MDDLTYKAIPYFKLATEDDQDADPRVVKQIFSVTGEPDTVNDIIKNGAYRKTLKERPDRIKVLWQHNFMEPPIGVPVKLQEVGKDKLPDELLAKYPKATGGLYGEIKYLDTPRGEEILQGIKAGAITENSIGFDLVKWKMEGEQKLGDPTYRIIEELRLWDVSPVNWGAHPATQNVKGAVPFKATTKAEEDSEWDAGAEMKAAGDDLSAVKAMCAWFDTSEPDSKSSYKLPHHRGSGDQEVVWKGVAAAMAALLGARGGVDIPDEDRKAVYSHLAKHYEQFDKEPPDFKLLDFHSAITVVRSLPDPRLIEILSELKAGRVLNAANLKRLKDALTTLNDILFSAEPPDDDESKGESVEYSAPVADGKLLALTVNARIQLAQREMSALKTKFNLKGWVA